MEKHWSDEELISHLYLTGESEPAYHCDVCSDRWREVLRRRRLVLAEPRIPIAVLQHSRGMALERVEAGGPRSFSRNLALGVAAMLVLAVGLVSPEFQRRTPAPVVPSDEQVVANAVLAASSLEPAPVMQVQGLFEVRTSSR